MDDLGRPINLRCTEVKPRRRVRRIRRGRLLGLGEVIDDNTDDLAGGPLDKLADLAELGLLDGEGELSADDFDDIDDDDALSGLGILTKGIDHMFIGAEQFNDPVAHEIAFSRREIGRLSSLLRQRTNQLANAKKLVIRAQKRKVGQVKSLRSLAVEKGGAG